MKRPERSSIEIFADHDDFTRLISRAFLVLRLQVQVLHDHSAVVLEESCNFSNLTFLTACDDLYGVPNPNMHLVKHGKAVWFALLSLPSLKLQWKGKSDDI
jgi:hypothetical protein